MKIEPVSSKKKLLYSVGVLCASLTSCDDNPFLNPVGRQNVPGIVPRDHKPAQPEELPQPLAGDVPYIPDPENEPQKQDEQSDN